MKQTRLYEDTIKKPSKPHRTLDITEIPTQEEIEKRYKRIEKLKMLGISTNILDNEEEEYMEYEEDLDKLQASILVMQDKEIPKDLEQRLLNKIRNKDLL